MSVQLLTKKLKTFHNEVLIETQSGFLFFCFLQNILLITKICVLC